MLHLIILTLLYHLLCLIFVSANCGDPGKSEYVNMVSFSNSFDEGSIVSYVCVNKTEGRSDNKLINVPHEDSAIYYRTCQRGKWSGEIPRCSKDISESIRLTSVKVTDIETGNMTASFRDIRYIKDKEFDQVGNYSPRFLKVSESDEFRIWVRTNSFCISSGNNRKQKWILSFNHREIISYIELRFYNDDSDDDNIQARDIKVWINNYRECKLVSYGTGVQVVQDEYRQHTLINTLIENSGHNVTAVNDIIGSTVRFEFLCEALPEFAGEDDEINSPPNNLTITINSSDISDEIALCAVKLYQLPVFKCGKAQELVNGQVIPEDRKLPIFKNGEPVLDIRYYLTFKCNDGFKLHFNGKPLEKIKCGLDGKWLGEMPTCKPIVICPLVSKSEFNENVVIENSNFIFWNETLVATFIKGATLAYLCRNGTDNDGHKSGLLRKCGHDGKWSGYEPNFLCYGNSSLIGGNSVLWVIIITMVITLLVGGALVIAIIRVKTRRRRETEMAKKQKFDKEEGTYDDVANGDGDSVYEEIQDVMYEGYYEIVGGECYYETCDGESDNSKVRYVKHKTDNTMQGSYVRMCSPKNNHDVQQQSSDYLPIEPTDEYLQILPPSPISQDNDNAIEH